MSRVLLLLLAGACADPASGPTGTHPTAIDLPGHNECLGEGEEMSAETCRAVVEEDGRLPTVAHNASGTPPDPYDPRLFDEDYAWLTAEAKRCTCVCCHSSVIGGPGTHRWDIEYQPVWIDSASDWALQVFAGYTDEYEQTLPSDDPARVQAVVDAEIERRRGE